MRRARPQTHGTVLWRVVVVVVRRDVRDGGAWDWLTVRYLHLGLMIAVCSKLVALSSRPWHTCPPLGLILTFIALSQRSAVLSPPPSSGRRLPISHALQLGVCSQQVMAPFAARHHLHTNICFRSASSQLSFRTLRDPNPNNVSTCHRTYSTRGSAGGSLRRLLFVAHVQNARIDNFTRWDVTKKTGSAGISMACVRVLPYFGRTRQVSGVTLHGRLFGAQGLCWACPCILRRRIIDRLCLLHDSEQGTARPRGSLPELHVRRR